MVGTQGDKRDKREVSREDAMKLSYFYSCNYFETSALYGENLDLLFSSIISDLRLASYYSKILSSQPSSSISSPSSNLLLHLKNIALLTKTNTKDKSEKKEIRVDKKTKKMMKKNSEGQTIQLLKDWMNQIDERGISIIPDSSLRNQLVSSIPSYKIAPLLSSSSLISNSVAPIFSAFGPPLPSTQVPDYNELPPLTFKGFDFQMNIFVYNLDYVCCKSISAYPFATAIQNANKSSDSSFPSPEKKDTPTASSSNSNPSVSKSIPTQQEQLKGKKRQGDPICVRNRKVCLLTDKKRINIAFLCLKIGSFLLLLMVGMFD